MASSRLLGGGTASIRKPSPLPFASVCRSAVRALLLVLGFDLWEVTVAGFGSARNDGLRSVKKEPSSGWSTRNENARGFCGSIAAFNSLAIFRPCLSMPSFPLYLENECFRLGVAFLRHCLASDSSSSASFCLAACTPSPLKPASKRMTVDLCEPPLRSTTKAHLSFPTLLSVCCVANASVGFP